MHTACKLRKSLWGTCGVSPVADVPAISGPRNEGVRRPAESLKASDEPNLKCSRGTAAGGLTSAGGHGDA